MSTVTTQAERRVARPLRELVALIREDMKHIEAAGLPYKIAAGGKLLEAKSQQKHGEWGPWLKRHFSLSQETARQWMHLAEKTAGQNPSTLGFSSLNDFHRQTGSPAYRDVITKRDWHGPVNEAIAQAQAQAIRIRNENLSRAEERKAEHKLALQLIDIGFKALASKLHPDKGGSRDAMSRLNRVRARLKVHA